MKAALAESSMTRLSLPINCLFVITSSFLPTIGAMGASGRGWECVAGVGGRHGLPLDNVKPLTKVNDIRQSLHYCFIQSHRFDGSESFSPSSESKDFSRLIARR